MKNAIMAFLSVCLLVTASFWYKAEKRNALNDFPVEFLNTKTSDAGPPLFLFIFFSQNNCTVCLEVIQVLNKLPAPFVVTGIIPEKELSEEKKFRMLTGATFRLKAYDNSFRRLRPHYAPSIYGVSSSGEVLFIIPGVPQQAEYFNKFIVNFYGKSIEHLIPPN